MTIDSLHLLAVFGMWIVVALMQWIHYPMFQGVDVGRFFQWHSLHTRRITFLVLPLMVFELVASLISGDLLLIALTLLIFALTGLWSAPLHARLSRDGFSQDVLRQLLRSNLVRVFVYSAKLICMVVL
jgi:hypothetical protein